MIEYWGVADDGVGVLVECELDRSDELTGRWPPFGLVPATTTPSHVGLRLTIETTASGRDQLLVDGRPTEGSWERVESELSVFAADRLSGLIAIHAALLEHDSRVLLIPGNSGAGKTTLAMAAYEAGATLLSDEYALVRPNSGLVTGWPRPVRIRQPGGRIERADIAALSDPVPVALVALVAFRPEQTSAIEPCTEADAVMGMMANTVSARTRPDESLDAVLAIARSARLVSGPRGEAGAAARDLLALLAGT